MKLNKQEQIIKEKMKAFRPKVDTDQLWSSLSEHVPEKKKRGGFIYFAVAAVLLLGITAYFSFSNSIKQDKNIVKEQIILNSKDAIVKSNSKANKIEHISDDESKIISEKLEINDNTNANANLNNTLKNRIQSKSIIKSIIDYKSLNTKNSQINIENNQIVTERVISENLLAKENKNIRKLSQKEIFSSHLLNTKLKPIDHKRKERIISTTLELPKTVSRNYFLWNIGVGFGNFKHSFTALNEESKSYAKYINSKGMPSPSVDLGISYHFAKRFFIKTGLNYSQLVTQIHPKWEKILNEENNIPGGLKQRLVKSASYEAIAYNYQNSFDIPISFGIGLFRVNNFSISAEAGTLFNIFTYSKGVIYDELYKLYYYDNNENNPYNKRFDIGWQGAITLDYRLRNFDLYFQPKFSSKSISYQYSNIKINEKYSIYDLKVGVRYRL